MKLATIYGSTRFSEGPDNMAAFIGKSFWCGSSCTLREEESGKVWSVWSHGGTQRAGIVVVRKGARLLFGIPEKKEEVSQ